MLNYVEKMRWATGIIPLATTLNVGLQEGGTRNEASLMVGTKYGQDGYYFDYYGSGGAPTNLPTRRIFVMIWLHFSFIWAKQEEKILFRPLFQVEVLTKSYFANHWHGGYNHF